MTASTGTSKLTALGWDAHFAQQLGDADTALVPARVVAVHRSGWHVLGEDLDLSLPPRAEVEATVGDWLLVDPAAPRAVRCLERKSLFQRRAPGTNRARQLIAANVDILFVVSSCNEDFNVARLERYLAIGREAGTLVLIVLTKADRCGEPEDYVRQAAKLAPGVHVEAVNALDAASVATLAPWIGSGQTVALLGSSGVGKSTLTNTLLGEARIATQGIREDDAKGRHTTTAREMHELPGGGWLIDTPGMRELQLTDTELGLDEVFAEIAEHAASCRFADCGHEGEPGCAVAAAIQAGEIEPERLARWHKLVREEAFNSESLAERRARYKSTGKLYKRIQGESKARKGRS